MNTGNSTLDWLVLEHEGDEFPAPPRDSAAARGRGRSWPALVGVLGVFLAGLAVAGNALTHAAGEGLAAREREVEAAVALQEWPSASAAGPTTASDAAVSSLPHTRVTGVTFDGDLAVAEVIETRVLADGQPARFRTMRFFRFDGVEWAPTAADERFWGARLTLETERLVFHYRTCDRDVVEAAAADIDAAYGGIRDALGLSSPAMKLAVFVDAERAAPSEPAANASELHMPSPALWARPVGLPSERLLEWRVLPYLASRALSDAQAVQPVFSEWNGLTAALYHWLLLQHNELLADWRTGLIAWRRGAYANQNTGDSPDAAEGLSRLCAGQHVAERSVWLVGSNALVRCFGSQRAMAADLLCGSETLALGRLWLAGPDTPSGLGQACGMDPLLATTVFDYAVSAHGPDAVARLRQGFHEYRTWEELIPAVFGVSAEEFEAGWQAWQMRPVEELTSQ